MFCNTCKFYSFTAGECHRLSETWPNRELTGWCGQWVEDPELVRAEKVRRLTDHEGTWLGVAGGKWIPGAEFTAEELEATAARADALIAKRKSR